MGLPERYPRDAMPDHVIDIDAELAGPDGQPGMERRMVLRVLHRWRELAGDRDFPAPKVVTGTSFREFWPYCFVLDCAGVAGDPIFIEFGEELEVLCGRNMARRPARETPAPTIISETLKFANEVLRRKVPVTRGGEFALSGGATVLYRSILLPLGDDDDNVTHIVGAANCREIAAAPDGDK